MLGIDTNVLVRFLVRDDERQFAKAHSQIQREVRDGGVVVSLLVQLEAEWVLRSRYGLKKSEIAAVLSGLLEASNIRIEDESSVEEALDVWSSSAADFTDCLIGSHNRRLGCRATTTFDITASKLPGFVLL